MQGFIRSVRKQKRFAFAEISDGSTIQTLQAILTPDQAAEYAFFLFPFRLAEAQWRLTACRVRQLDDGGSCRDLRSVESLSSGQRAKP